MRQSLLITILTICLSLMITACGETEFSSLGSVIEKLENGDLSVEEMEEIEASPGQVEEMKEVITEVMDPEVKEPVAEVMAPKKDNIIDRVKMYQCAKEPPIKKVILKDSGCYLRDSSGDYVRDSNGEKVRVGYCDKEEVEVIVENPANKIPKYMICHARKGMQSEGKSLCLPRVEIEDYIQNARAEGGTSYMGPCK